MALMENRWHIPVLCSEVLQMIEGGPRPPQWGLDVTFGRGGHTRALLEKFSQLKILALDRDQAALDFGITALKDFVQSGRLIFRHGNFHGELPQPESQQGWDFILADLGVSSPQLDDPLRGFSFYQDGPLDMRMDQQQNFRAADIINSWSGENLIQLFQQNGEIRRPHRVVQRILETRRRQNFSRTLELAHLIEKVEGWRRKGHHPATAYFLALRLEVNSELSQLRPSLERMMGSLAHGGRLVVLTFHSLEDRIIKYAFKESVQWGHPVNKKVIAPSREECRSNPRARSAQLRVFEKVGGHDEFQTQEFHSQTNSSSS